MLENPIEKVNALVKLADVVGKKTLVMWCLFTTFTSGYFFVKYDRVQNKRINENSAGYERLVEEIKGIKKIQLDNTNEIKSTIPKLDTTITNVEETLKRLKNKK